MATVKVILDTRSKKKDGTYPVKLYVSHHRKVKLIGLDISVLEINWEDNEVKGIKEAATLNRQIKYRIEAAKGVISVLTGQNKLKSMEISELVYRIENSNQEPEPEDESYSFFKHIDYYISNCKSRRTAEIYSDTRRKVTEFSNLSELSFDEINLAWLKRFEKHLLQTNSVNTVALDMRNIRAVFNDAINEDRIDPRLYPFRKFKITKEKTIKRALTVDQLKEIRDFNVQSHQERYRDLFMLTFYLIGINTVDLLHLKPEYVKNRRIEYIRSKVDQTYSIKIEPEAQEILEKYRGESFLINPMDKYTNYKDFLHRWNENLSSIGKLEWVAGKSGKKNKKKITPLVPDLTTYWARHTWGTIALSLGVDFTTISKSLGHETGSETTWIYIKYNLQLIDDANRRVLDFILS